MGKLRYNNTSKLNKNNKLIVGYCANCLEKASFRATYDTKEMHSMSVLTCTRCLASTNYSKKGIKKEHFEGVSFFKKITFEQKAVRFILRVYKFFFTGTWNRKRFDTRLLRGK